MPDKQEVDIERILTLPEPFKTKEIDKIKARQLQCVPLGNEAVSFQYDGQMVQVPVQGTMLTKDAAFFALQHKDGMGRTKPLIRVVGFKGLPPKVQEPVDDLHPESEQELDAKVLFERGVQRGLIENTVGEVAGEKREGFYFMQGGKPAEFLAGKAGPAVQALKAKTDILRTLNILVGD